MSFSTFSAQICGVLTLAGLAVFIMGGAKDDDGQGVNRGPKHDWEVKPAPAVAAVKNTADAEDN